MKKNLFIILMLFMSLSAFAQTPPQVRVRRDTLTTNSKQILAYNKDRRGFTIYALGDTCYFKYSNVGTDTVTTTSFSFILYHDDYFESSGDSRYTGRITGKSASGTKYILITEYLY